MITQRHNVSRTKLRPINVRAEGAVPPAEHRPQPAQRRTTWGRVQDGSPAAGRRAGTLALLAILALAATLRLWNLGATEFKFDEARVANLAAQFVDSGSPPLFGMGSSTGIDNPPLAVYLMSAPALVSRDPLIATAFVALLNVASVWGCYALGSRYWGKGVGLLAALLLAASPWAVFYSRKVWAQDLLLPFVLLYMALLYAWLVDGRRWSLAGAIALLAAATQIHFAALALVPLLALALLAAAIQRLRRRQRTSLWAPPAFWAPLGVGIALALLTYLPYLAGDAASGWRNVRALVEAGRAPAQTQWEAVRFALLNVGGREIHALAGPDRYQEFLGGILNLAYWPDRIEEALAAAAALYLVYRCWRARRAGRDLARYGLLWLWLIVPVLFFLRFRTPVYPHYLIPLYPAPYLALAIMVRDGGRAICARLIQSSDAPSPALGREAPTPPGRGLERSRYGYDEPSPALGREAPTPPGRGLERSQNGLGRFRDRLEPFRRRKPALVLSTLAMAGLIGWQSYLSLSIHAYVQQHHTPGGMGTPLRILRQVVHRINRYTKTWDNQQVVMVCPGDNPRWDECPAVFGYMTSRSPDVRFVDGRASLLFPHSEADTLVVLAPAESTPEGTMPASTELGRYADSLPEANIPLREHAGAYRFYRLAAGAGPTPTARENGIAARENNVARLENGIEVIGYDLPAPPRPGQTTRLSLYWRVEAPPADPPAQGYSFANHVLAADGQRIGQGDGPGYRVELWRAGDTVVSWFDLALAEDAPPPPYRLRTGMYVYTPPDRFVTIQVVDAQGQPVAEAVEWPLE
jgi:hypothetical protein